MTEKGYVPDSFLDIVFLTFLRCSHEAWTLGTLFAHCVFRDDINHSTISDHVDDDALSCRDRCASRPLSGNFLYVPHSLTRVRLQRVAPTCVDGSFIRSRRPQGGPPLLTGRNSGPNIAANERHAATPRARRWTWARRTSVL